MPVRLADVLSTVERLWPAAGAEPWDAPGLVTGDPSRDVERVLLTVDAVAATVDEAVASGADLVVAHHPLLLRGVTSIAEDRYKGALLAKLIRADCALVGAHTNADIVETGTSAVLAERLGLVEVAPIVPNATDAARGLGRVGRLAEPTTLGRLARRLADILPPTATGVRVAGGFDDPVGTVAVCGGAGDSLLSHEAVRTADAYVTADLRHHPASEAREQAMLGGGPALVDVSHWASEWLWLDAAARELREAHPELEVVVSDLRTDPWDFQVVQ
ncbi:GTP cyclohydrolase 1 type 2 [Agromyces luteolus]|uniref:GTP cyclohydrolase 1 type 2 homolog n=1 Tax=Agromyces luteolus TaxID=88373 RepID=A0A7C9HH97_9MICO|nr:Nif3-like dinuclear metal center hexameric protein [Agromyces luteolus]MUN06888.1 Nif3-like dinuclear metal center hexameric protein [Agromyces luteolus]GLK27649.1 GTP cyclohydrolase 1 type 2 [Agromyces luteolus]